ncbi:pyridoxamine 5'-phosphate oxidase family protein [Methylobrevis pamukkalensis]|uniref:Pyridoxamine 5'-phosphate oxidase n=1 Tax=Methylobrevis pamukkalensis TaxID=1439726 RepID=A0A1E3H0A4_9HYPH|nr:pyridoxamine 5'-phosphate oxidase family protein [Methylobrevis pamukkalensis]ODN69714.1 Pyridoxamine 5'-phosphate oxidase [Methylobrevis pamukkalensis]
MTVTDHDPTSFPVSGRNRLRRLHTRGSFDRAAVYAVLDAAMLCHVAYAIDGQPYCTPTLHWREGDRLYWHGSSASRMLRHLAGGTPACLTVSHLDGLVLARSGFNHSANYRSAMCFGTARILDDPDEKAAALRAVVDRLYPDRTASLRTVTAQEIKATMVIGMDIEEASAKVRAAGVGDDEEDYAHPVWAGVIPVKTVLGAAEPCVRLDAGIGFPPDLASFAPGRRLDEALLETQRLYEDS